MYLVEFPLVFVNRKLIDCHYDLIEIKVGDNATKI